MNLSDFRKIADTEGIEVAVNSIILQGPVFCFRHDQKKYFYFKNNLSKKLDVHTNDIEIVGSAKLGFSLKQANLGKPFDKESDIDVAVISDRLFERAWSELISIRDKKWLDLMPKERGNLEQCQSDIYWGYVSPDKVPRGTEFSKWWWSIFQELSSCADYERRKIRGRLFKSWKRTEMYYCYSVQQILKNSDSGG